MSKSAVVKSVHLPEQPSEDQAFTLTSPPVGTPAWKQEVNDRLAAHRTRRGNTQESAEAGSEDSPRSASSRAAEAAARVAARYAKAPSYKQLLAGEARAVVRAAGAAAEAARNAQAAAQAVLTGLEFAPEEPQSWQTHQHIASSPAEMLAAPAVHPQHASGRWQDAPPAQMTAAELAWREYEAVHGPQHFPAAAQAPGVTSRSQPGVKPHWEEELPLPGSSAQSRDEWAEMRLHPGPQESEQYRNGLRTGDPQNRRFHDLRTENHSGPALAHDPIGEATVEPMQPIAANLIEFPKELVAARKARPRQAEGPFYDAAKDSPQLSIFEVDPEQLAPPIYLSDAHIDVAPPEWAKIELDHSHDQRIETFEDSRPQEHNRVEEVYAYQPASEALEYRDDPAVEWDRSSQAYAESETEASAGFKSVGQGWQADSPSGSHAVSNADSHAAPNSASQHGAVGDLERDAQSAKQSTMRIASPARAKDSRAAAWESIVNLPNPVRTVVASSPGLNLQVAPLSDRMLAAVVDGALVTLAFLAAAVVVVASTNHPPAGRIALIAGACGMLLFWMLYQFLFFSYAEEGTPGMRYARIALCSFEDDNPGRSQMRKRIPAMLVSALPAGLGLAWALVDGDHLALHDHLTRTYQRKY